MSSQDNYARRFKEKDRKRGSSSCSGYRKNSDEYRKEQEESSGARDDEADRAELKQLKEESEKRQKMESEQQRSRPPLTRRPLDDSLFFATRRPLVESDTSSNLWDSWD